MDENIVKKETWKKGKCSLELLCKTCGEPVTIATDHGIFCKHRHGEKEAKKEMKAIDKMAKQMCKLFKW